MKTREKKRPLKPAKTDREMLQSAKDQMPGGKFADKIAQILFALKASETPGQVTTCTGNKIDGREFAIEEILKFGLWLAMAIRTGDAVLFHELADSIDTWHDHTPMLDKRKAAFIEAVIAHKKNQSNTPNSLNLSLELITKYMEGTGAIPKGTGSSMDRTFRRWAAELKIKIKGQRGRRKLGQNSR